MGIEHNLDLHKSSVFFQYHVKLSFFKKMLHFDEQKMMPSFLDKKLVLYDTRKIVFNPIKMDALLYHLV